MMTMLRAVTPLLDGQEAGDPQAVDDDAAAARQTGPTK